MFRRVVLEEWHQWVPYVSTGILLTIYLAMVGWALLMKRNRADHMATMPLENNDEPSNQSH
ncbi:MAG: hypothetical protein JNK37_11685 [Verrucomicrobiales bacterium]|nr:hypothetical protein [Verrucomicrobiales bacterium]